MRIELFSRKSPAPIVLARPLAPGRKEAWTEHRPPSPEDLQHHLEGELALGVILDRAISLDFDAHAPEELSPLLEVFRALDIPAYHGPGTTRGGRVWLFLEETGGAESLAHGLAGLAKAVGLSPCEGYPKGEKPVILPLFGALNGNPRPLYGPKGERMGIPFQPQTTPAEALHRLVRAGELLQVALSRRPEGRHDTLLAFLNLAHRGGCLEEAEVLFGHRVLWQAWGVAEDGTRSLETWRDEVARAAQAAASEDYGRKRGLPFLEDQGYDLRGLGWLVSLRWPKPQPLEALLPQLPGWPKGLLPPALEGLVYACSENKGVEATPMAMAVLTAASALLAAKGVTVHPEPGNASWREPPVLWTLLIAPPGFGKSPLIRTAAGPLWKVEEELAQENLQAEEAFRQELAAWEAAPRKERGPKPMPPARHRLVVSDITPEALGEVLAANPAVLALLDEFGGLLAVWRREDRAHGRAFYLSCHSGEPVVVDRLSRGTLYLKRPLLALLGGIQPGPWQAFLGETQRLGREADGLLQRLVPVLGRFTPYREDPPGLGEGILQAYEEALISLWEDPTLQGLTLQPTPEAFRLWRDWRADTEEAVRDPSQPEAWRSLLAKRLGLTARLAGILAVLWGERAITERAMGLAILLVGEVLEAHARKAWRWGSLDLSPALRLGRYLFQHRVEAFTRREAYRNEWGGITTPTEAEAAIGALLRAGWLEERQEGRKTKYFVNPRIGEVCGGPDKA